jgi:hypothetical protein
MWNNHPLHLARQLVEHLLQHHRRRCHRQSRNLKQAQELGFLKTMSPKWAICQESLQAETPTIDKTWFFQNWTTWGCHNYFEGRQSLFGYSSSWDALYLSGMWFGVDPLTDNKNACVWKRLDCVPTIWWPF